MANLDLSMLGSNTPKYTFGNEYTITGGNQGLQGLAGGTSYRPTNTAAQSGSGGNFLQGLNSIGS